MQKKPSKARQYIHAKHCFCCRLPLYMLDSSALSHNLARTSPSVLIVSEAVPQHKMHAAQAIFFPEMRKGGKRKRVSPNEPGP